MLFSICLMMVVFASLQPVGAATPIGRDVLNLDGEWRFKTDPDDRGASEKWLATRHEWFLPEQFSHAASKSSTGQAAVRTMLVPGCWDTQGVGKETDKLRHNYIGKAWYQRSVTVPADWAGKRLFLCIGGVHRYADVWVNGQFLGEHIGYLSPFEFDITAYAQPGKEVTVSIRVDSKQRWDVDALTGCFDIIDAMDITWGGIWGHVWLAARSAAWVEDLHVRTKINPAQRGTSPTQVGVSTSLAGDSSVADGAEVVILDMNNKPVARTTVKLDVASADKVLRFTVELPKAQLWSPDHPVLYTARVVLTKAGKPIDQGQSRFGIRQIEVRGSDFYLNGAKLFLRGYGDDAIYPETMAAPSEKSVYLKRLRVAKSYGFNYVRHHSHILPPEYYDAAAEVGMLISAEFPIAYDGFYKRAKGAALELYKSEWTAAIKRLRNYPSIFDWSMSNEMGPFPVAGDLYKLAKELDPDRLVIDTDGLGLGNLVAGTIDRPTVDFYSVQFDAFVLPLDNPNKYRFSVIPPKPVICHETGNFTTFPRLDAIELFRHNIKPFWLTPAREKLGKLKLLGEAALWSRNSEKLYLLQHKMNLEDLRKNEKMSGYDWWLLQDYWTGTNGLLDWYFRPKQISPEQVRQFNNDVVLLQDGLPITCRTGQEISLALNLSNYSPRELTDGMLYCEIKVNGQKVASRQDSIPEAKQGSLTPIARISVILPSVKVPQEIEVRAKAAFGESVVTNQWRARLYPKNTSAPKLNLPLYCSANLADSLREYGANPIPIEKTLPTAAIYVVGDPDQRVVEAAKAGSTVICLKPQKVFPSVANRFKSAWWLGNDEDSNLGTVVYDNPITRGLAPEGWCDGGWYRLVEGSRAYVLDKFSAPFTAANAVAPDVLIRAIDLHTKCRSKALLWQARLGKGCIIVCGLNVLPTTARREGSSPRAADKPVKGEDAPEKEYLLNRLIAYAGTSPKPKSELPQNLPAALSTARHGG